MDVILSLIAGTSYADIKNGEKELRDKCKSKSDDDSKNKGSASIVISSDTKGNGKQNLMDQSHLILSDEMYAKQFFAEENPGVAIEEVFKFEGWLSNLKSQSNAETDNAQVQHKGEKKI